MYQGYDPTKHQADGPTQPLSGTFRVQSVPRQPKKAAKPPRIPKKPARKPIVLRPWMILLAVILVGAVVAGAYYGMVYVDVNNYQDVFAPNIVVDGINIGGMTANEGITAVRNHAQEVAGSWYLRLVLDGEPCAVITADSLGLSFHVDSALNNAWALGKRGTIFDRQEELHRVMEEGVVYSSAMTDADTHVVDSVLSTLASSLYIAPQNASLAGVDISRTNPFTFHEESNGRWLDVAPIREQILEKIAMLESGDIPIVVTPLYPSVTVASLQDQYTLRSSYYTIINSTSEENRNANIARACELINGKVLNPGATFSFNGAVGERTMENGFFSAPEYANGEHVTGIGGGVCQVSSTVYLAALTSGLQITNRAAHSMKVNYTEYSLDATVYWAYGRKVDLTFKNTTDSTLYLKAYVGKDPSGKTNRKACIVSIYGPSLGNISYGLESRVIEEIPKEFETRVDTDATYVTYSDKTYVLQEGYDGVISEGYLLKYENGILSEQIKLSRDEYKPSNKIVYVGATER